MDQGQILDKARDLFARLSFSKTSVADIAKACGLGKGSIYLYFKSKDDIFLALIEERIAKLVEEDAPFYNDPGIELKTKVGRFLEEVVDETFALKQLIFGSFDNLEGRVLKDVFFKYGRFYDWCVERLLAIVRGYKPYSDLEVQDLREDIQVFLELMIGKIVLFLVGEDWNDKEGLKTSLRPLSPRLFDAILAGGSLKEAK